MQAAANMKTIRQPTKTARCLIGDGLIALIRCMRDGRKSGLATILASDYGMMNREVQSGAGGAVPPSTFACQVSSVIRSAGGTVNS